ncbi:DUF7282 domain-containing protein [Haladaptatus sp. NG-WS-4]
MTDAPEGYSSMYELPRRTVIGLLGGGITTALGSGLAAASHVPELPGITFNKQTSRVQEDKPTTIVVPRADLPEGGWIVIHEGQHEDQMHGEGDHQMMNIIGHSEYLEPGHYGGLKIAVSPSETGSQTLTAVLHKDDGDEEFNHPGGDPHYTTSDGAEPVRDVAEVRFKT